MRFGVIGYILYSERSRERFRTDRAIVGTTDLSRSYTTPIKQHPPIVLYAERMNVNTANREHEGQLVLGTFAGLKINAL